MLTSDLLAALRRDSIAFVESCEVAGTAAAVPSCPEWTVGDLLWHLTEVQHFWRTIVSDRSESWEGYEQPPRPDPSALPAVFRGGLTDLLSVLGAADPAQSNWTWSSDRSAGFVIRRMAHEAAMHRWDAASAASETTSIDPTLASDGIDEFLHHFLHWSADAPLSASTSASVHLHCTDVPGEWTVREGDDGFVVTREHAKGDCAMRGAAADLLLALWRRVPLSAIDIVGDTEVAARFVALSPLE